MNIVTSTCVYPREIPESERIRRLAGIGFTCLDLPLSEHLADGGMLSGDDWREWLHRLQDKLAQYNVSYTHSHAWGSCCTPAERMRRNFEVCNALGIKYTVIHPMHLRADGSYFTERDEFIEVNTSGLRPIVKLAEEYGVIALVENLLWEQSAELDAITGLADAVDSPFCGWCFDTGHLHCLKNSISPLRNVSRAPLSLHIQDNRGLYGRDEHMLPGDGTIDWKEFLQILHEINYGGDLVFEAHHQSNEAPDDQRDAIMAELYARARKMLNYYSFS